MPDFLDLPSLTGPFDIIGDLHGCFGELEQLLRQLGYRQNGSAQGVPSYTHPEGRLLLFVGDLVDRGPEPVKVLQLVMQVQRQQPVCAVVGNHDDKLLRKLQGRQVQMLHGLADTYAQLQRQPAAFREQVFTFLRQLPTHLILDQGGLVIAHAGLSARLHGTSSKATRAFCLYGLTTGQTDEFGLPVRLDWAAAYADKPLVVYGHTPVPEPRWKNNTVNIDTGCAFGGKLSALRYPEKEVVSVPALRQYAIPARPFLPQHRQQAKPQEGAA